MLPILLVGLGGFIGAILRYLVGGWFQNYFTNFPAGTFLVNFVGSFVISVVMFGTEYKNWFSDNTRFFLAVGLLGSFTTMSTFNYETFKLLEQNEFVIMLLNIFANIVLGLVAIYLGRLLIIAWMR